MGDVCWLGRRIRDGDGGWWFGGLNRQKDWRGEEQALF